MRIKKANGFVVSILLFAITTLTYKLWPSLIPINKVSGFLILITFLFLIFRKVKSRHVLLWLVLLFEALVTIAVANDQELNINDLVYFTFTVLVLYYLVEDKRLTESIVCSLQNNRKKIFYTIVICEFFMMLSFFFSSSYVYSWGSKYFIGFGYSEHAFGCGACLLGTLILFYSYLRKEPKNIVLWFIPIFCVVNTGARTYLVPFLIILFFYYKYCLQKKNIKFLLIPIAIIGIALIFQHSNMLEKFINSANNVYSSSNKRVAFSNGRFDFWLIDIKAFLDSSVLKKLFGNGFDYVYQVNEKLYGMKIWAHNDYIDVLLSVGVTGFIVYMIPQIRLLRSALKKKHLMDGALVIIYLVFVTFVNGLFTYQHFLMSFVILYSFFICVTDEEQHERVLYENK